MRLKLDVQLDHVIDLILNIDETRYPELIINLAKTNDFISRADVVQLLHVDDNKAYRLLKALADQGILEPVNKGRYAKYRYCGNA